jgi:hypothetical protein
MLHYERYEMKGSPWYRSTGIFSTACISLFPPPLRDDDDTIVYGTSKNIRNGGRVPQVNQKLLLSAANKKFSLVLDRYKHTDFGCFSYFPRKSRNIPCASSESDIYSERTKPVTFPQ